MQSPLSKIKHNLRAKIRRNRGLAGATTIQGIRQGMQQQAKAPIKKLRVLNTGSLLNAQKNANNALANSLRFKGKKLIKRQ